ncbi:MAG: hypothetical protein AAFX93_19945 [Verrucomicrobiota bacterium]
MANTLSADLIADIVADKGLTVLNNRLATLRGLTMDFSADPAVRTADGTLQPIRVAIATGTGSVQVNPSSFETGDTTVGSVLIQPEHISKSFHLTSVELQQSQKFERQMVINLDTFANAIHDRVFANLTAANFGAAAHTGAQSAFGTSEIQDLWAAIEDTDQKFLYLDGVAFSKLLPTNTDSFQVSAGRFAGAYGFDEIIHTSRWSAAETNAYGFACSPQAIAAVGRRPDMHESVSSDMTSQQVIELPDLGLSVEFNQWVSRATRARWASFDLCFGSAYGAVGAGTGALAVSA